MIAGWRLYSSRTLHSDANCRVLRKNGRKVGGTLVPISTVEQDANQFRRCPTCCVGARQGE
jgi:hypothetical protein